MNNNLLSKIKKGPTKLPPKIMLIGVEGVGKSTAGAHKATPEDVCTGCASLDDVTLFRKAETANEEL